MRTRVIAATLLLGLALPALSAARVRLTGRGKDNVILGARLIRPGRHGDIWIGGAAPRARVEKRCFSGFRSTVNTYWAALYTVHHADPICRHVAPDGVRILNLERWTNLHTHTTAYYWTPTAGFDQASCTTAARSYTREPSPPERVIDDLLGLHCSTDTFGIVPR